MSAYDQKLLDKQHSYATALLDQAHADGKPFLAIAEDEDCPGGYDFAGAGNTAHQSLMFLRIGRAIAEQSSKERPACGICRRHAAAVAMAIAAYELVIEGVSGQC